MLVNVKKAKETLKEMLKNRKDKNKYKNVSKKLHIIHL